MPVTFICQPIDDDPVHTLGHHYLLKVYGYFEFSDHCQWHAILDGMTATTRSIDIDFSAIEYMDSSALGLLLQLREKITDEFNDESRPNIRLIKVNKAALKLLQRSGFDQLFELDIA